MHELKTLMVIYNSKEYNKLIQGKFLNDLSEGDEIEMRREDAQDDTIHEVLSNYEYFKGEVAKGMNQRKEELRIKNYYFIGTQIDDLICGSWILYYQSHSVQCIWMNDKFIAEH